MVITDDLKYNDYAYKFSFSYVNRYYHSQAENQSQLNPFVLEPFRQANSFGALSLDKRNLKKLLGKKLDYFIKGYILVKKRRENNTLYTYGSPLSQLIELVFIKDEKEKLENIYEITDSLANLVMKFFERRLDKNNDIDLILHETISKILLERSANILHLILEESKNGGVSDREVLYSAVDLINNASILYVGSLLNEELMKNNINTIVRSYRNFGVTLDKLVENEEFKSIIGKNRKQLEVKIREGINTVGAVVFAHYLIDKFQNDMNEPLRGFNIISLHAGADMIGPIVSSFARMLNGYENSIYFYAKRKDRLASCMDENGRDCLFKGGIYRMLNSNTLFDTYNKEVLTLINEAREGSNKVLIIDDSIGSGRNLAYLFVAAHCLENDCNESYLRELSPTDIKKIVSSYKGENIKVGIMYFPPVKQEQYKFFSFNDLAVPPIFPGVGTWRIAQFLKNIYPYHLKEEKCIVISRLKNPNNKIIEYAKKNIAKILNSL